MAATKSKKKTTDVPSKKKTASPKKTANKPSKKEVPVMEEVNEEHEHSCGCGCEADPIEKNPARAYVLRDIWFDSLNKVIEEENVPEGNKMEMLFLTLSNALLDMIIDILPADLGELVAENMDDFLAVTLVNKEYNVDLLQKFKEDFVNENGDTFEDEEELNDALSAFEDNWWNSARDDLEGKSPNEALEEMAQKYNL
ncbi:MAG: hypothetical protein HPY73_08295 [Methanomassiliicoccales archaeon]|nr:MAG: hypothetical protein HPY73_08295 [Methanomassiliicoccales archaeon]